MKEQALYILDILGNWLPFSSFGRRPFPDARFRSVGVPTSLKNSPKNVGIVLCHRVTPGLPVHNKVYNTNIKLTMHIKKLMDLWGAFPNALKAPRDYCNNWP